MSCVAPLAAPAGALPFWVFSPAVAPLLPLDLVVDPALLANPGLLQVGYGATILSFLGGVHWGLAMTNVGGERAPPRNNSHATCRSGAAVPSSGGLRCRGGV